MKNILFKSLSVLSVSILATGCIEETFPEGSTTTQTQLSASDAGVASLVNAVPVSLVNAGTAAHYDRYGDQLDFGLASIHMRTDHMLEDIACMADNPGYDWAGSYARNSNMGAAYVPCSYFWDCYYPWIKSANDVINTIDPEAATSDNLNYLGQAYTYRAMFYLDLARLYMPVLNNYTDVSNIQGLTVPIIRENTTEEEAMNNPRAPKEEMYAFILDDLAKAETYLTGTNNPYTQPTLTAVYGLMAKAYLEMGYWDESQFANAAEYARKAIETSGKTPLTEAQWTDPVNGFNNGSANNSWIWGLPITSDNFNNLVAWVAHLAMEAQWGYGQLSCLGINRATYEAITPGDFRKLSWLDPDWTGFGGSTDIDYQFAGTAEDAEFFINEMAVPYESIKFRPGQGNATNYTVGNAADVVVMRIEEMYFIEMEAIAHSDLARGIQLLNSFMNDYRMTAGSTYDCSSKSSDLESFLDEMLLQKRIEFWGEGVNIYDYKRLQEGITRGYEGTNHAGVHRYNTDGPSPMWNIVISRLEYQANTAINDTNNNPDPSGTLVLWSGE